MFASRSLTEHLVRGLLGFTALVVAFVVMTHESLWSIPLALGGVFLLRGCPTCWTVGLLETVWNSQRSACRTGRCDSGQLFQGAQTESSQPRSFPGHPPAR